MPRTPSPASEITSIIIQTPSVTVDDLAAIAGSEPVCLLLKDLPLDYNYCPNGRELATLKFYVGVVPD